MRHENLILLAAMLGLLAACADKKTESAAELAAPAVISHEAFVRHMHLHAIHLARLNEALAAGDLEAAATPAYWLSRHEAIDGLPYGWGPFIEGMRKEGQAVERATDLFSARAAAARLASNCSGCHKANGITVEL